MKFIFIALIKFYKKRISPLTSPKCRFYPSCSTYALAAVEKFGAFRGLLLALWRLLRCNPWSMGGIDYVPDKFTFKVKKYDYSQTSEEDVYDCMHNNDDSDKDKRYKN